MSIVATGDYTIIDYNDAPLLNGWINMQGSKTQGYTPDTDSYIPDYTTSPLNLIACLFVSGTSVDLLESPTGIITEMKWSVTSSNGVTNEIVGATSKSYTVRDNLVNDSSLIYSFSCKYTQPASKLAIPVRFSIDINKVINGTGIADAVILAPSGNIFKNSNATSLTAECQLWNGSIIVNNISGTNFKWWKMDASGTGGSHGIGSGWKEIVNAINGYSITFRDNASVITIPKDDVFSSSVYMCTVLDSDTQTVLKETITFLDTTDPIFMSFDSTGGSIFKNGIGSTILKAMLFQNGQEIDALGTKYTYNWYKYDANGDLVNKDGSLSDGSIPYAIGKSVNITGDDVFEKATFKCTIN